MFRSAWMFAVGALDAYFCDAYTDLVAASIISKSRQGAINLPDFVYEIRIPIRFILGEYTRPNWRWRMAARQMMSRENVLSLKAVQDLFNKFFREDRRFFGGVLENWITHPEVRARLFGIMAADYNSVDGRGREAARKEAKRLLERRFRELFQRRHDCIHNCDRPRVRAQGIATSAVVVKVLQDVEFLVRRCDEHINTEFRQFLADAGGSPATIAAVNY